MAAIIFVTTLRAATASPTPPMLGAFVGWSSTAVTAMEQLINRPLDYILNYINQSSWVAFDDTVPSIFQQVPGMKMLLAVPAVVVGDTLANAATGADNPHYLKIAQAAAAVDPTMIIRVGWEFNYSGSLWYATPNPAAYIATYRQMVGVFRSVSPNFKFEWCASYGGDDPDTAYPGDDVVDYIGTDIYENTQYMSGMTASARWNELQTGSAGLNWLANFAAVHNKQIAISEYATNFNDGAFPTEMAYWIESQGVAYHSWWESQAAFDGYLPDHPNTETAYINAWSPLTLSVTRGGSGSGTVTSTPSGIDCGSICTASVQSGTQVMLTASAAAGSSFSGWSGAGCSGTGTCAVTMSAAESVTATFMAIPSFNLSVASTGTGSGTVTSTPSGINCGSICSASFQSGTQVILTASAAAGSTFAGWGGACTGACTITMSAAESVSATFTADVASLTVAEAGTGTGQVTSSPAGINCSASTNQCAVPFTVGSLVTLSASASAGSSFTDWSGDGCSGTGTCQLTISADTSVKATFKKKPTTKMLSVTLSGGGSGTVASSPSGINCGSTCSASFDSGSQVSLSAVAANGSTFAGWGGAGCSGIETCSVTLSADTSAPASFVQNSTTNIALVAAILPGSRSVVVGNAATAFATMINSGPGTGTTCTIAPQTSVPASFLFQATDPSTNAVIGTANTPVNISQGEAQSFLISLTPNAPFNPTDIAFNYACANASPMATLVGINTLNLSASITPVPDIVALAASGDPGYVDIPGATGTGDFAVATVNLGSASQITVSANTGTANLPVTLTLCQTDPTSGTCLAAPTANVVTTIAANATPTFGVFVTGSASVADMPGVNRVFVLFTDAGGVLRGETSVAMRTQ
jgi:hypothetical protein